MAGRKTAIVQFLGRRGSLGVRAGTATASSKAVSHNVSAGKITTESLTLAAGAEDIVTVTNTAVKAGDFVLWNIGNGTNNPSTGGVPGMGYATASNGQIIFGFTNLHASQAMNGTLVIDYMLVRNV